MKVLYLDCGMGAAGDMLTAALLELLPETEQTEVLEELNNLGIPGVKIEKTAAKKCGITGTRVLVTVHGMEEDGLHAHEHSHGHGHAHSHTGDSSQESAGAEEFHHHHFHNTPDKIAHILSDLKLPERVKKDILEVYQLIAEAESHVHGVPISDIHFHEVGTMDALADITAVSLLIHRIHPDEIVASPVHVGAGQVQCAHGILPVPAPATAFILQGVPVYGGSVQGELCTPTGAALLKHFVSRFDEMPVMQVQAIGYGMGKKDFSAANCVRAMLGEQTARTEEVVELSCNVDDMTAEAVGFAMERLLDGGALDVYTTSVGMKKSRPGTLLQVLCQKEDREQLITLLFRHTSTIGIRETTLRRHTLNRTLETIETPYGPVQRKVSSGYGVSRIKYEYEDLVRIAREQNLSLDEVRQQLKKY